METRTHSSLPMSPRSWLVIVLLPGMLAVAAFLGVRAGPPISDKTIELGSAATGVVSGDTRANASLPPNATADWWSTVQEDIRQSEYHVTWQEHTYLADVDAAYHAPNRAQNLRTYFAGDGIRVIPRAFDGETPPWHWGLTLAGYGHAEDMLVAGEAVRSVAEGNRFEYHYTSPITAWYVNAEDGLEQGFTITQPPPRPLFPEADRGEGEGEDLVLEMTLSGDLLPSLVDDRTLEFALSSDETLRYGGLLVTDAGGRQLPARFSVASGSVAIIVDGANATYPITLGATLTGLSTSADWMVESNKAGANLGYSVGTAGDVNSDGFSDVIVGAHHYDSGDFQEGRAYVFHGSPDGLVKPADWTADGDEYAAWFGRSVGTAGDVNGDGYADVIVGAQTVEEEFPYSTWGRAFVYHGSPDGLGNSAAWTVESDQADAEFGQSVGTAGDVNADGYADVIVGAPAYGNGENNEGRTYVYHGSSSGLSSAADWTAESNQAWAKFGQSVGTAGDVNGDGCSDVIVGAPYYEGGIPPAGEGPENEGWAFVYHGSDEGLSDTADWTTESESWGANLGWSVGAAGDVNGDGYADVIVGAPSFVGTVEWLDQGEVLVFYGSASGLDDSWWARGDKDGAYFGYSVGTAGDVNGDGYADIVVGAYRYSQGQSNEGRTYLYQGSASGLLKPAAWTAESDQAGAEFGTSVGMAGDVNGDGYTDVIVGAPCYNNGQNDEGQAFLYHGSGSGLSSAADWGGQGGQASGEFGYSVGTAGDVNGDGYADVIVGAHWYDHGQNNEGQAYTYHGSGSGLSTTADWTAESNQASAEFGYSVGTAGDVNGDGFADIIVGARWYNSGDGRAYVYHGSDSGIVTPAAWTAEGDDANAEFGNSVGTAGDVNGDGYADVIVGAHYYGNGQEREGRAFVFHGAASGLNATDDWAAESNQAYAEFGHSVGTAGDVNGDGYADVIVGARRYEDDSEQPDEGWVFVFHGSPLGLSDTADWTAESNKPKAEFGTSVGTAGDVNGDGYGDIIVGAMFCCAGEPDASKGRAYVFHGSDSGLVIPAAWTADGEDIWHRFGCAVGSAGDINRDGYADVIVGARFYSNGQAEEGAAYVYHGSASGPVTPAAWMVEGNQAGAWLGSSVGTAGDVNGDGYADVIVGAYGYDNGKGQALVYLGNSGAGPTILPQQRRADDRAPVGPWGQSISPTQVRLSGMARSPFGRSDVKLQWEIKPEGTPFDGTGLGQSSSWTDGGLAAVALNELVSRLSFETRYHWRGRVLGRPCGSGADDGAPNYIGGWVDGGTFFTALSGQQVISSTGQTDLLGQSSYVSVTTQGGLSDLTLLGYPNTAHPQENATGGGGAMLDRYFNLVPDAGGYELVLCLGYDDSEVPVGLSEASLRLCRWTGSAWSCPDRGANSSTVENLVCADNVTDLSDWTMGAVGADGSPPEMDVWRLAGTPIADGGSDDVGGQSVVGTVNLSYTIENTAGLAPLYVSDVTVSTLSNCSNFSVNTGMPLNVTAGATATLDISFEVGVNGAFSLDLEIVNSDVDESPYDIQIVGTGTGGVPEIDVQRPLAVSIADGGTDDLGTRGILAVVDLAYTLENAGTADLWLLDVTASNLSNCSNFSVDTDMPLSVGAMSTGTLDVSFDVDADGAFSLDLDILNSDGDEHPYDIQITGLGEGLGPEVTIDQADTQPDPTKASPVLFTAVFNEPINASTFTGADVHAGGTATTGPVTITEMAPHNGTVFRVSVEAGGMGTVRASIPAGGVEDLIGNPNSASTSTDNTVTFDGKPPRVTIDQAGTRSDDPADPQPDPTNVLPIRFTAVFNEPIDTSTFTKDDVEIVGSATWGGGSGTTEWTLEEIVSKDGTKDGTTFSVSVEGVVGDGTVLARIPAGGVRDLLGNKNLASGEIDNEVTYETVRPGVTIDQAGTQPEDPADDQPDPTDTSPVFFTAIFDEPVEPSSFAPQDVTIGGTATTGAVSIWESGGGRNDTFTVRVEVTGDGKVQATVPAGGVEDAAGNTNTASTSTDNTVRFEHAKPKVTIDQAVTQPDPTDVSPVVFTAVFNEDIRTRTFTETDVTVGGTATTGAVTVAEVAPNNGTTFAVSVVVSGEGTVTAAIPAGGVEDRASPPNTNKASTSTDNTVTYDTTNPYVTINQAVTQVDPTDVSPVVFTAVFNEPIKSGTFAGVDVVTGGTAATGAVTVAEVGPYDDTTFEVSVAVTADGTVTATIPAGGVEGADGNPNNASTSTDNMVTFDATGPGVTIDQSGTQADPTNASPVVFTAVFSEPISAGTLTSADVTVGGTAPTGAVTVAEIAPHDGTTFEVSVAVTGDGTVTATIPAGGVDDPLGNANSASTSSDNAVTYDVTKPDVTIDQASTQADPTHVSPVAFTVVFDEAVNAGTFTDADVDVGGTAPTGAVTVAEIAPNDGTTFEVSVVVTGDGTVTATIPAGGVEDLASNTNYGSTSTDNTVVFDASGPGVTINQAGSQADPTNASPVAFTAVFTEPIDAATLTSADVTVGGTATTGAVTVTEVPPNNDTTFEVSVVVIGEGVVTSTIPAGGIKDPLGNANSASTSTDNAVTYDTTKPDVTIDQAGTQADPTNASPVVFAAVFNEPVNADTFSGADVSVGGTATTGAVTVTEVAPNDGTTFEVSVVMSGEGTVTATIPADGVEDLAGNTNNASTSTDNSVTYDTTKPYVTINQAGTQPDPTNASPVVFTAVFNEAIDTETFTKTDVIVGGTASTGAVSVTEFAPNDGTTFVVSVVVSGNGTVTATIPEGGVQDLLGNTNNASTSTDNTVTYDTTKPNVTINQAATQADPTTEPVVVFTAVFDGPVNTGTFTTTDVAIGGTATTVAVIVTEIAPNDGTTFSVSVVVTADGTVTATIPAGGVQDLLGNTNNASTSTDNTVTYDVTSPYVTVNQAGIQPDPANTSPVVFTALFNEPINASTFSGADVLVGGTATTGAVTVTQIAGFNKTKFHVSVEVTGDGTVTATIPAGGVQDPEGHPNHASTSTDNMVTYDGTKPNVTVDQAVTQADPTSASPVVFAVVFDEPINTGTFTSVNVAIGGTATTGAVMVAENPPNDGTTFSVSVVVSEGGTVTATIPAGGVEDLLGNTNNASTSTDNQVTFVVADLVVTKSVTPTIATPGETITYTVTFTNAGQALAAGVIITDIVPDSVTVTGVISGGVPITDTGATPPYVWSVADLGAGERGIITITGRLSSTLATGTFTNTAVVTTTTMDEDRTNNTSHVGVMVVAPDLMVTKSRTSPAGDPVVGESWTWQMEVTNGGNASAVFPGVGATVLQDTFPDGPSYTSPGKIALDNGSMDCTFTGNQLNCLTAAANTSIHGGSTFTVDVASSSAAAGTFNNAAADCAVDTDLVVAESNEGNNNCAADDSVTVLAHPTITKVFSGVGTGLPPNGGDPTLPLNGVSTLTFTISNPNAGASLSGLNFTDTLPSGVQLSNPVNQGGTCPDPEFDPALAPGGTAVNLTGSGPLAAASACTITVDVQGTTTGLKDNTTGTVNSAETGTGTATASDSLLVLSYPTITKTIAPDPVPVGSPTTVTFTISNPNATTGLNGLNFTDALPAGMTIATPPNQGGTCESPVFEPALAGGGTTIKLTGSGTLAPSTSCTLTVEVIASPDASYTNTTGPVGSSQTGSGASTGSDTVIVRDFPTISKTFSPSMIASGGVSTLTFTIGNSNTATYTLSGLNFTDTLPAGVQLSNPVNQGGTCPDPEFDPALAPGGTQVNLTGSGLLGLSSSCTIVVDVTSAAVGTYTNTTGVVGSAETGTGTDDATATLTVVPAELVITKSVVPTTPVNPGDRITYTIVFTNAGLGLARGVVITDVVPVSVTVASVVSSGVTITDTGASPPTVWDVSDLSPGQGGVITITGQLSATLPTSVFTNTAVITTTTVDEDTTNNSSDVMVRVLAAGATVETATGTGTVQFQIGGGGIQGLVAVAESALACPANELDFPHGFFAFSITGLTPCASETVVVTITLPSSVPPTAEYWKCHDGAWLDVTSLLGDNDGDNVLTLTLTDGGLGDDDGICNGEIVDDGGPGFPVLVGGVMQPVNGLGSLRRWLGVSALILLPAIAVLMGWICRGWVRLHVGRRGARRQR